MEEVSKVPKQNILYLDESGIDARIINEYGYSLKGKRLMGERIGNRKKCKRYSMIAGLIDRSKLIAKTFYDKYTNTQKFNDWIKYILIPQINKLKRGSITIVMDNAAFHKSNRTKELIEEAGHKILFLPPYSPDLNPIEGKWTHLKNEIRKYLPYFNNFKQTIRFVINKEGLY